MDDTEDAANGTVPSKRAAPIAGETLAAYLRRNQPGLSWGEARKLCRRGKVAVNGRTLEDSAHRLQRNDEVRVRLDAPRHRAGGLVKAEVIYRDRHLLVVNKPAKLLSVPVFGEEEDTLLHRVRFASDQRNRRNGSLSVVHRLDQDTSGLLIVSQDRPTTRELKRMLASHEIERSYLALSYGRIESRTIRSYLVEDRGDGLRGSVPEAQRNTKLAVTHLRVIERLAQATVVQCRLETGRQHQIRIHLSEAGAPLIGERVYIREWTGSRIRAPRHMLHAESLVFRHPHTGKEMRFAQPPPDDFARCLTTLRRDGSR